MEPKNRDPEYLDRYEGLFGEADKAKLFDIIAEQFYAGNFGQMSIADFETMMFSIYIERILDQDNTNFSAYSDYKLAKELGITQSRVSALKVKKQLQYPYSYNWQASLAKVSDRARYENGMIKLQIPDVNLYYDIKNAIEERGGFIEVSLTKNLLVVPLAYFLDLMGSIVDGGDRKKLLKCVRDEFRKHTAEQEFVETAPIGKQLEEMGTETIKNVIQDVLNNFVGTSVIGVSKYAIEIARNILKVIRTT